MGASVHLQFTDDDGKDIYPGGRYVKAEDWDADPEKVTAEVAEYLATLPVAAISTAPVKSPSRPSSSGTARLCRRRPRWRDNGLRWQRGMGHRGARGETGAQDAGGVSCGARA